jgi:8-oxo-dGTP pyrophosphatase MutT (NUDIX family)
MCAPSATLIGVERILFDVVVGMTSTSPFMRAVRALQKVPVLLDMLRRVWRYTRPRYTAGSVAVMFNARGDVLLVEHAFHAYHAWGLPGGYLDAREDPDQALVRELREELSLEAAVMQIVLVERSFGAHLDFAYLCDARGQIGSLSPELLDYRWVALSELPALRPFHRRAIENAAKLVSTSV